MQLLLEAMKEDFSRENDFKNPHELSEVHLEKHLSRGVRLFNKILIIHIKKN